MTMTPPASHARYVLWVLFGVNLMNFFDRTIASALVEPVRREFGLSDQQVGLLTTIFVLSYAIVGLPLGRLADTRDRTKLTAVGIAFWSALTAAGGSVWSFGSMLAARIGVGLGEAVCAPAGQSLIGDYFPPERRGRALALFMAGLPLGIFAAYLVSGALAARYGWRSVFWIASVPGVLLALLAWRMQEPPRGAADGRVAELPSATPFRDLARIPTFWWIVVSGATLNFHAYASNAFNTAYLMRFHGLELARAGRLSALSLGLVGLVGLYVGGTVGDRMRAWRPEGRLLLGAVGFFVAAPSAYLALQQPAGDVGAFAALMAITTASAYVYYGTVYSAMQDVVAPRLRGASVALYFFAMYVLGAAFGPVIVGTLSDRFARHAMQAAGTVQMTDVFKAMGLRQAMYVMPIALGLTAVILLAATRTVARDMAALQRRSSSA